MAGENGAGKVERLCTSIAVESPGEALRAGKATPASCVEVRLDHLLSTGPSRLGEALEVIRSLSREGKRVIATLREEGEGGLFSGSPEEKLGILARASLSGALWVDVEEAVFRSNEDLVAAWARGLPKGVGLIVSSHSQAPPPGEVPGPDGRLKSLLGGRPVVFKRVYTAFSLEDNVRVLVADALWRGELLSFNMGEKGVVSRVMAPWMGSPFTFAYPSSLGRPVAPGQLSDLEIIGIWRRMGLV